MRLADARLVATLLTGDPARAAPSLAALNDGGWRRLLAAADADLLSPELAQPLRHPALAGLVPAEIAAHVEMLGRLNAERNVRIAAQLAEIVAACAETGLQPLLLKGARAFAGNDAASVVRVMTDLDVLFAAAELEAAVALLNRLGYRRLGPPGFGGTHVIGNFARRGEPALIDVHRDALVAAHLLPAADLLARAAPARAFGMPILVAGPTDELLLAVLHEMVQDLAFRHGTASVRRLRDIAVRLPTLGPAEWGAFEARVARAQASAPLAVALHLVALIFGPAHRPPVATARPSLATRVAVGRVLLNARGLLPRPLNVAISRIVNAWASHNHRPREDGSLALWRARRLGAGAWLLLRNTIRRPRSQAQPTSRT